MRDSVNVCRLDCTLTLAMYSCNWIWSFLQKRINQHSPAVITFFSIKNKVLCPCCAPFSWRCSHWQLSGEGVWDGGGPTIKWWDNSRPHLAPQSLALFILLTLPRTTVGDSSVASELDTGARELGCHHCWRNELNGLCLKWNSAKIVTFEKTYILCADPHVLCQDWKITLLSLLQRESYQRVWNYDSRDPFLHLLDCHK